eukprot:TRINITY_DN124195_c0_g1_i1.p1 TRINITY_DN124195_c0_g1~~TRINITY_DN124195_c0_g1_i1.p1  ORF type:complete len:237 (-),score=46.15 TRINITY_DN124195_c0_g1_i1:120-830(-)
MGERRPAPRLTAVAAYAGLPPTLTRSSSVAPSFGAGLRRWMTTQDAVGHHFAEFYGVAKHGTHYIPPEYLDSQAQASRPKRALSVPSGAWDQRKLNIPANREPATIEAARSLGRRHGGGEGSMMPPETWSIEPGGCLKPGSIPSLMPAPVRKEFDVWPVKSRNRPKTDPNFEDFVDKMVTIAKQKQSGGKTLAKTLHPYPLTNVHLNALPRAQAPNINTNWDAQELRLWSPSALAS